MNRNSRRSHSIDTLFVITLLGLFLIFLLMMVLFSTQAYRTAVEGNQENNNLYTASAYITEKFRQHDSSQSVSLDTLDNLPAFCMTDTIDGTSYVTYMKSVHKERMISNAAVFDFELSADEMAQINQLNESLRVGPDPDTFDF